uniref:Protein YIPF n=1 Tax=Parascaris univalens TaxID=6257 RepID=A0A915ADX9_PARUN
SSRMDQSYGAYRRNETIVDFDDGTPADSVDNLGFYHSSQYDSSSYISDYNLSGSMITTTSASKMGHHYRKLNDDSRIRKFLESRGFDWLLEIDDDSDEEQKSLLEELDIDFIDIYYKIRCVLLPLPYFRLKLTIVRESPDFWGPLMIVMAYALLSLYGQFSVLSWILTIWFIGSFFVFFLARALGGEVSYSQVLGIVGYCLIPLVAVGLFIPLFSRFRMLSLGLGCFGILWSVYSAGTLLCVEELQEKRTLLLYPVFLLYVYFFSLYSGV